MNFITVSEKYTGFILLRYFAHGIEDQFCAIYLPPKINEQIKIAQILHDTADGHLEGLSAFKCYFNEVQPFVFFLPNIPIGYFSDNPQFAIESNEGKCYWHIKPIKKIREAMGMHCEVVFIEFHKTGLCFIAYPYPNDFIRGIIITAIIKYDDLK